MKKILFIVNNLIIGGVEKVCWEIINNLDGSEYKCDFLVAVNPNENQYYDELLKQKGCSVYKSLRIYSPKDKKNFLKIEEKLIKDNQYDIVHSHVDFMNAWTLKVAKSQGVPTRISHVHTTMDKVNFFHFKNFIKRKTQQYLLKKYSTHRLACSKKAGNDFYNKANFEVLYNGFNIDEYTCISKASPNKNIITVGRICEQKNPYFILEILKDLVKYDDSYMLYWIGEGNLKTKIEKLINKYDLNNNVVMVGATTEIIPYLRKCFLALYPSKYEGLGISIVEAQLAKCFTYYSDIVPKEADLGYGISLPLDLGSQKWAEKINYDLNNKIFINYSLKPEMVKKYDIKASIKTITDIYN